MIIFLNGCSSSGKTTFAKALQLTAQKPLMHIGVDTFIDAMPKRYLPGGKLQDEGFSFIADPISSIPKRSIKTGWFGAKIFSTRSHVLKAFAEQGIDLIIDEVLEMPHDLEYYVKALENFTVYFVGVFCDLEIMAERELLRETRMPGTARGQYDLIHACDTFYDFTIDTTCGSSFQSAHNLLDFIAKTPNPKGFKNYLTQTSSAE